MNAAIWRLTLGAAARDWQAVGIMQGFLGLLNAANRELSVDEAARHARFGGAWLGVSRVPDLQSRISEATVALAGFDALAVIGGEGSIAGARAIAEAWGRPVVGLPATIDNDVAGTDLSLGYDTALSFGLDVADRQRDTAEALPRVFCIETLGGSTGHIAQMVGRLAGADVILIPEAPLPHTAIVDALAPGIVAGAPTLAVASEGYPDLHAVLRKVCLQLGARLRMSTLGHAQRGGVPTPRDRALAAAFADQAISAAAEGRSGYTVLQSGELGIRTLAEAGAASAPDQLAWRGVL